MALSRAATKAATERLTSSALVAQEQTLMRMTGFAAPLRAATPALAARLNSIECARGHVRAVACHKRLIEDAHH